MWGENVEAESIKLLEDIMGKYICLLSTERVFKLYVKQKPWWKVSVIPIILELRTFCSLKKLGTFCSSETP